MPTALKDLWGPYILTEDYQVVADQFCYTLQKRFIIEEGKRKGEADWRNQGYFGNVHDLIRKFLNIQITENLGDLGKAVERMDEVEKNLDNLVKIKYEREKSWMS